VAIRSALVNVMVSAALKAARGLVRDFGEVENLQVSKKGPGDFVSAADMRAQQTIQRELSRARPGYGFLLEETGTVAGDNADNRWIVDPLDGTTNFLHGIPHFAISIALERRGEIVAGVVYDPTRDELFRAEKGQGAFVNDRRLRVSARRSLADAVVAPGVPPAELARIDWHLRMQGAVIQETLGLRRFGAAALDLAYVAAGRLDGFWEIGLSPWDVAGGSIIVREAGGRVTDMDGTGDPVTTGNVLAANDHLHMPLGRVLRNASGRTNAAEGGGGTAGAG